ncbi:MAG: bifunctional 5,10-methylenetetrahydrofolate dehydrogenase/5,10-methenyltetrahydrofolate cyclohydrolase [bacterium]
MILLRGVEIRNNKRENLKIQIETIKNKKIDSFIPPVLVIFQIGDNKASGVYIEQKKQFAAYIGAEVLHIKLPDDIEEEEVLEEIRNYNNDSSVHGIIVQLPIPKNLSVHNITNEIDYRKDVDGLSSTSLGLLVDRDFNEKKNSESKIVDDDFRKSVFKGFIPATTKGVLSLFEYYDIELEGKNVCIVGRSVLVGKPTALVILAKNATITVCHSKTKNLKDITKAADIIISAIGVPNMIDESYVSLGQTIIDIGIVSREEKNENGESVRKLCGDVAFDEVSKIVNAITPVPGGVGPLTVASLFENLFESFYNTLL